MSWMWMFCLRREDIEGVLMKAKTLARASREADYSRANGIRVDRGRRKRGLEKSWINFWKDALFRSK